MRFFWILLILGLGNGLLAQELETAEEAFLVVEEMPRFSGCEELGLSPEDVKTCATKKMLEFVYQNITYPEEARQASIEGTVVVNFVILKDGSVSEAKVVREIGGGCGAEALRVVNLMNEKEIKWIPGVHKGKTVNVSFNLPVKYKLQEDTPPPPPPPYIIAGLDTIYTEYDEYPAYGEKGDLQTYLESIPYPSGVDSCVAGSLVTQIFVSKEGTVKIGDIFDYSNLGFDYQFEVIKLINATNSKWAPAIREGRPVNSYLPLRIIFKPKNEACKATAESYDQAYIVAGEAEDLYANGDITEAIGKWEEALVLMPNNTEFLLLRGQAYLEINEKGKACADLQAAKKAVPLAPWVEQMLPFICTEVLEEEGVDVGGGGE